jgi:hypothetical protein
LVFSIREEIEIVEVEFYKYGLKRVENPPKPGTIFCISAFLYKCQSFVGESSYRDDLGKQLQIKSIICWLSKAKVYPACIETNKRKLKIKRKFFCGGLEYPV